ncbi:type IV secretory system conjugative DNA transfer family protein [Roseobacteraceae bacterium S113]
MLGGVGAGKTSGSGNAIARSYLRRGFGGLVLCAKKGEADRFAKLAAQEGRGQYVIRFDASGTHRLNIMDYTVATLDGGGGFDQNLSAALLAASEAARVVKHSGGGGDNPFFRDAAEELLLHALPLLKVTQPRLQLRDLMRMIDSTPRCPEEARSEEWQKTSFCAEVLLTCGALAEEGNKEAERIADEHADYFLERFSAMGDRTRSSIVATLTSTLSGLLTGKVHELFCTTSTVCPEMSMEGAIIILDMSVHEFGPVGAIMQAVFKSLWMKAIQQRKFVADKMRPCFLWADECQYFLTEQDAEFLSTSREYGACPVYLTQSLTTFYTAIGGNNAENNGKRLMSMFQCRIFHANTDHITNEFASQIIGKVKKQRISKGSSSGRNNSKNDDAGLFSGGGSNTGWSQNIETYDDLDIHPEYFGNELRTGGKRNRFKVDAIVIRSARTFAASGRNRLKVTFDQKAR